MCDTLHTVLAGYAGYSAEERRIALATLCARPAWARELLAAVGDGRVGRNELSAFQLRALRQLDDPEITRLLELHVGQVRAADATKEQEIARVREVLERDGPHELARGREVFARTCQQCHTLFGTGGKVGPDITGSQRANLDYLLSNVIDPSAVMAKNVEPCMSSAASSAACAKASRICT